MDILGPFPPSQSGNRYILLMIDQFTKWVEIHAIPEQTAEQTARIAVNQFFTHFGAHCRFIQTKEKISMVRL